MDEFVSLIVLFYSYDDAFIERLIYHVILSTGFSFILIDITENLDLTKILHLFALFIGFRWTSCSNVIKLK